MSSDRPPTPAQAPAVNIQVGDMAQMQPLPAFPSFNCQQRSNSGSPWSTSLPPVLGRSKFEGRTLPPIQLPPLETPTRHPQHPSKDALCITNLLSRNPESPGAYTERQHRYLTQLTQYHTEDHGRPTLSKSSYQSSPNETRSYPYSFHQIHPHDYDRWPASTPALPTSSQHGPAQALPPAVAGVGSDLPRHSPALTANSFGPSYYSSSSEPSPRSSVAPLSAASPSFCDPPPMLEYHLSIRQQPVAARACGFGERDRRVVDPPPILELKVSNRATGAPEQDSTGYLALHCTLLGSDGNDVEAELPLAEPDMPSTKRLMGTLVASPYEAKDENGTAGTFFVFPDLSCRSPGRYRLAFKLIRIDPMKMQPGVKHRSVAAITTNVFSVYTAKDFPGMRASSALLKALRRQGLNVGVKKGSDSRRSKGKSRRPSSSDEEEESEDGGGVGGNDSGESGSNVSPKTKGRRKKRRRRESQ